MTQLTLNAKISNITKVILFFANYDKELNLFDHEQRHLLAQLAIERIAMLKKIQSNISFMQKRLVKY